MFTEADLESQKKYFIENGSNPSYFQWLSSKGTNYTCYVQYMTSLNDEAILNDKISHIRKVVYAIHSPLKFLFFYWTILIFFLHKFNFKKPVMKIVLGHFIIRATGDLLDRFGEIYGNYYVNLPVKDEFGTSYTCQNMGSMHPLRWLITRQIATVFWYCGEIIGDWYPLLRAKAVIRNKSSVRILYVTCGLFNLSKIALIILHWTLSPSKLYDENGVYEQEKVNMFYFYYWIIQLIIIYASTFYEFSVYFVLKRNIFIESHSDFGFIKKFKSLSEYRILISSIFSVIFLPLVSITILLKFFYYYKYNYTNLDFSFDEIRISIANVQYYMIFIDQILLMFSQRDKSSSTSSEDHYSDKIYHKASIGTLKSLSKFTYNTLTNSSNTSNFNYNDSNSYTYSNADTIINVLNSESFNSFSIGHKKSLGLSSNESSDKYTTFDRKFSLSQSGSEKSNSFRKYSLSQSGSEKSSGHRKYSLGQNSSSERNQYKNKRKYSLGNTTSNHEKHYIRKFSLGNNTNPERCNFDRKFSLGNYNEVPERNNYSRKPSIGNRSDSYDKNKSIASYDDYDTSCLNNEWSFLRK